MGWERKKDRRKDQGGGSVLGARVSVHPLAPFVSEMGKPWKANLKDLPNAAAFAAKAARQNQGAEKWKR